MNRRHVLGLLSASAVPSFAAEAKGRHLATNMYPWMTFARREGVDFVPHAEELLARVAKTGLQGYEPIVNSAKEFEGLGGRLQRHGLEMRSIYVNSTLHEAAAIEKSQREVLEIARAGKALGVKIVVTNPSPIKWGGKEAKTDGQLKLQAQALDELGGALLKEGMVLAYHNHDVELKNGAREFHHMLTATDAEKVRFCLDSHWIYRGCGDSEVALFDAVAHYHERVVELHLRQSRGGVWQEVFTMEGDVDYGRLFEYLEKKGVSPHVVLEQAVEGGTPKTMGAEEAHREGRGNLAGEY
ncbi:MAG: sugar phosphate isomerase/epimerase family protein [Verrucomicrobiaceae bacterium]